MAKPIRSTSSDSANVAVTTFTPKSPVHNTGDLLIVVASKYKAYDTLSTATTGWVRQEYVVGGGGVLCSSALFYKIAASNAEPMPVIDSTGGTANMMATVSVVVAGDFDSVNPIITSASTQGYSVNFNTQSLAAVPAGSLVMHFVFGEDDLKPLQFEPNVQQFFNAVDPNRLAQAGAWFTQKADGTTPQTNVFCCATIQDWTHISIAIAAIKIHPSVDATVNDLMLVHPMSTSNAAGYLSAGLSDPIAKFGADTIDGLTPIYDVLSGDKKVGDLNGCSADSTSLATSGTSTYYKLYFGEIDLAAPVDLSNHVIYFANNAPANAPFAADYSTAGHYFGVTDGTNLKVWKVDALDTAVSTVRGSYGIAIDLSSTSYYSRGVINLASITGFLLGNYPDGGTHSWAVGSIYAANKNDLSVKIIGGSADYPVSFEALIDISNTGSTFFAADQKSLADGQIFTALGVQIGDGVSDLYFDAGNQSLSTVGAYDENKLFVSHYIPQNTLPIRIKAAAGNTIKFTPCVLNSPNFANFEIDPASSNAATYSFNQLTLIGFNVTLQNVAGMSFAGMSCSGCRAIQHNGAGLSGMKISGVAAGETASIADITSEVEFAAVVSGAIFENNTNAPAFRIVGNQTGIWTNPGLTMSGNTVDIEYTGATDFKIAGIGSFNIVNSGAGVLSNAPIKIDITVLDSSTQLPLVGAHVYLESSDNSNLPKGTQISDQTGQGLAVTDATGHYVEYVNYTGDQPFAGRVRLWDVSTATYYTVTKFVGIIKSDGYSSTLFLIKE